MKLESLKVKKLFGKYDYDVEFNKDITLLFGRNGCGKTTILNLISDMITGYVYKLFDFEFDSILIKYAENGQRGRKAILVTRNNDEIILEFNGEKVVIEQLHRSEDYKKRGNDALWVLYRSKYPILDTIHSKFKCVYLSLDRYSELHEVNDLYYRRLSLKSEDIYEPETVDSKIKNVEALVSKATYRILGKVSVINDEFRNKILKSTVNLNIFKASEIPMIKTKEIDSIASSYISILKEFDLADASELSECKLYFDKCKKNAEEKTHLMEGERLIEYLCQCYEMQRIRQIVRIAEEAEMKKQAALKPIEIFLKTVNDFISQSDFGKTIWIDPVSGRIYFTAEENDNRKLSIQFLSSGERQLIIFFANLLFGFDDSTGIFVVDEPELSLHLVWQKVFIEKALQVNDKIQFIFATHSPEIIGRRRSKTKKLERVIVE